MPMSPAPDFRTTPRRRALAASLCAAMMAAVATPAIAGKAHQHSVATMDVALEGRSLKIRLDTPLANVLGFERAPKSDYERQRVDAAVKRLRAGEGLFKPYAPAGCVLGSVQLDAPVLGLAASGGAAGAARPPAGPKGEQHAELAAMYEFECQEPAELKWIDVGLFSAFTGFRRVDVQLVTERGQGKQTLQPRANRLAVTK